MTASATADTVARNPSFIGRVGHFHMAAAIAVMAEPGTVAGHAERVVYAQAVLGGSAPPGPVALGVVSNPTIKAALDLESDDFGVTDGDLEFVVEGLFDAYAGVSL